MKSRKIPPCTMDVPEPLLRAAEESERRKNAALDRLEEKLAGHLPPSSPPDRFGRALVELIDADKLALEARGK